MATKKPVFIHLGIPKTGSTAIQSFLQLNELILMAKGFYYPKTFRCERHSHNPIGWILLEKYELSVNPPEARYYIKNQDRLLSDFKNEIKEHSEKSIIISSETLFSLENHAVDDLIAMLDNRPVKVIFFIRNMVEVAMSYATFIIKNPINDILDYRISNLYDHVRTHLRSEYSPGPKNRFDLWNNKIGKANLIFRKYKPEYKKSTGLFADFLDILGLSLTEEFNIPSKTTNASFVNSETIYFKDILNRLNLKTPAKKINKKLLQWDKSRNEQPFVLPKSLQMEIARDASEIHKYLLCNYLEESFRTLLDNPTGFLKHIEPYNLSFNSFFALLNYLNDSIEGFGTDFMVALMDSFNNFYEERLHLNELEKLINYLLKEGRIIAFWGCGNLAERLFKKYSFLNKIPIFILDSRKDKQGKLFWGKEILSPESIPNKNIDTVFITSIKYTEEITDYIRHNFQMVKTIKTLFDIPNLVDILKSVGY